MGVGFASTVKVDGILGTYDDTSQTTHKDANILHPVVIEDENTIHEEPKYIFC
jgi:hypothetical protein